MLEYKIGYIVWLKNFWKASGVRLLKSVKLLRVLLLKRSGYSVVEIDATADPCTDHLKEMNYHRYNSIPMWQIPGSKQY